MIRCLTYYLKNVIIAFDMAAKATASSRDTITSSKWSLSTGGVVERN